MLTGNPHTGSVISEPFPGQKQAPKKTPEPLYLRTYGGTGLETDFPPPIVNGVQGPKSLSDEAGWRRVRASLVSDEDLMNVRVPSQVAQNALGSILGQMNLTTADWSSLRRSFVQENPDDSKLRKQNEERVARYGRELSVYGAWRKIGVDSLVDVDKLGSDISFGTGGSKNSSMQKKRRRRSGVELSIQDFGRIGKGKDIIDLGTGIAFRKESGFNTILGPKTKTTRSKTSKSGSVLKNGTSKRPGIAGDDLAKKLKATTRDGTPIKKIKHFSLAGTHMNAMGERCGTTWPNPIGFASSLG